MTIKRRPTGSPESYPKDFVEVCDHVYERLRQEQLMLRRRLLELDNFIFGRPDWKAVVLGEQEVVGTKSHGAVRVLCGHEIHWLPNVVRPDPEGQVTLHVPTEMAQWFKIAMKAKLGASVDSLLIISEIHDACVLLPLAAVSYCQDTSHGQSTCDNIAASFLILSLKQPNKGFRATEDEVLILLNPDSTVRFVEAATKGQKLSFKPQWYCFPAILASIWDTLPTSKIGNSAQSVFQHYGDLNDRPAVPGRRY
ncbi:hypothetical protein EYZ11_011373 [Aspergillus tanneri]|uniref:Uncharacterized protein n=1 Tax=Aspergillus tanneri TaxID=1220188 RepID=A0A4S3J305_9EURO|nr:uncharacterized protein ATNIH1004_006569 [Aspergillus tanneri]KAA8647867.1 hypothetical protein ATNIH1004_006569 [Aspergillus tanneri]THC89186.1 hypothetical protein EYZ11_011373 [Aspergillus tanneri]